MAKGWKSFSRIIALAVVLSLMVIVSAAPPAGATSYPAATYTNDKYGFSIQYPKDWVARPELVTAPELLAAFGVSGFVPGVTLSAYDADAPESADWIKASFAKVGFQDPKVLSYWIKEETLADGTKAYTYKAGYLSATGYDIVSYVLDADKAGKRIRVNVFTIDAFAPYDEAKFSEIAHTLTFSPTPPAPTQNYTLSTSVSPSGGGSISSAGGQYGSGTQLTLTATPAAGYTFGQWSGSASGSSSTTTITMNSNKSVTANFTAITPPPAPPPPPPTPSSNQPPVISSLVAQNQQLYPSGSTTVTCIASDPDGDVVRYSWSASEGSITGVGNKVTWIAPNKGGSFNITVIVSDGKGGETRGNVMVTVTTTTNTGPPPAALLPPSAPPPAPILVAPTNGATISTLTPTLVWKTSAGATTYGVAIVNTIASYGFLNTQYTVASGLLSWNTLYYWQAIAANGPGSYSYSAWSAEWTFRTAPGPPPAPTQICTLSTSVSPQGGGFVSSSGGQYNLGTQVTLTATAAAGYTFSHWSGSVSDSSPTTTIIMNSNKSVTAYFTAITPPPSAPPQVPGKAILELPTDSPTSAVRVTATAPYLSFLMPKLKPKGIITTVQPTSKAEGLPFQNPSWDPQELRNKISALAQEYVKKNPYSSKNDCKSMSVALWRICKSNNIEADIAAGNLNKWGETRFGCDHVWLIVFDREAMPIPVEATAGDVMDVTLEPYKEACVHAFNDGLSSGDWASFYEWRNVYDARFWDCQQYLEAFLFSEPLGFLLSKIFFFIP